MSTKTKKAATASKGKPVVVGGQTYHLIEGSERRGVLLIEQFNFEFANNDRRIISEGEQTLEEKKAVKAKGGIIAEGKIGHVDKPTANGRIYTRQIMEREIQKILEKNRRFGYTLGEVDHPGDGKSRVKHVGHVIHDMRVEQNGDIWGRYHVLPTTHGKDVITIIEAGGAIGSSSRGIGTTTTTEEGYDLVGEDFRLATFDLVSDPAAAGAYPKFYAEDANEGQAVPVKPEEVTVEHLTHEFPEIVRKIQEDAYEAAKTTIEIVQEAPVADAKTILDEERERIREEVKEEAMDEAKKKLREEFALKLISTLKENEKRLAEAAEADRASDPVEASAAERLRKIESLLGGTKVVEESGDRNSVITELRSKLTEASRAQEDLKDQLEAREKLLTRVAKKAYVDKTLALREDGDEIREALGDLDTFESVDALTTKLTTLIDEAEDRILDLQEAREDGAKVEASKASRRIQELERQLKEQRELASSQKAAIGGEMERVLSGFTERLERMELAQQNAEQALKEERAENARLRREGVKASKSVVEKSKQIKEEQERMKKKNILSQLKNYARRRGQGHHALEEALDGLESGDLKSKRDIDRFFSSREQRTSLDEQMTRSLRQGKNYVHSNAGGSRQAPSHVDEGFVDNGDSGEFFNEHAEMLGLNPDDVCGASRFI